MSTYRKIHGRSIQAVTTDPSETVAEGQIWYNTTSNTFKSILVNEAWVSASPAITALGTTCGSGTQTAGLVFSGADNLATTQEYNGSGWSNGGNLNTGRYGAGEATNAPQTAALCFGGVVDPGTNNKNETEEYDGSSWSEQNNLPTGLRQIAGFGLQTAAVSIGGYSTAYSAESYEYNGTSWTAGGDMSTSRERAAGCGLETAGLAMGGNNPSPYLSEVEEYDGSSWTSGTALPTATKLAAATGTQTDALFFMGNKSPNTVVTTALKYDGTAWTTKPSMATARQAGGGAGSATSAVAMLGTNVSGTALTTTEEFTSSANVITASAWASGPAQPSSLLSSSAGTGDTTAGMIGPGDTGGSFPGWPSRTLEFDGTNWSTGGNYPTAGNSIGFCGKAHNTQMGVGANLNNPTSNIAATYDGTNWTAANPYPVSIAGAWGAGTQTASVWAGGGEGPPGGSAPYPTESREFDGTNFSAGGSMPTARANMRGCGTQTAALMWGSSTAYPSPSFPTATKSQSIEYDGTSWTAGGSLVKDSSGGGGCGTQTAGFMFTPAVSPQTVNCKYDGTAWATDASNATARPNAAGFGTDQTSAIIAGNYPSTTTVEEYSVGTETLNVKTLTQS